MTWGSNDTWIFWHGDLMIRGSIDTGILWHTDLMTQRSNDTGIWWHRDLMTRGCYGTGILWQRDLTTRGSYDMGIWWYGNLVTRGSYDTGILWHWDLTTRESSNVPSWFPSSWHSLSVVSTCNWFPTISRYSVVDDSNNILTFVLLTRTRGALRTISWHSFSIREHGSSFRTDCLSESDYRPRIAEYRTPRFHSHDEDN